MLSFFFSRRNCGFPTPSAAREFAPPPPPPLVRGEGTLACGRGVGGVPILTREHTQLCSIYFSTSCYRRFYYTSTVKGCKKLDCTWAAHTGGSVHGCWVDPTAAAPLQLDVSILTPGWPPAVPHQPVVIHAPDTEKVIPPPLIQRRLYLHPWYREGYTYTPDTEKLYLHPWYRKGYTYTPERLIVIDTSLTGRLNGFTYFLHTAKTQYRKFETNIPRKGNVRHQSQFPHKCVCDWLYIPTIGMTAPGNIMYKLLTDTWMWKLGLSPFNSFSGNA